MRATGDDFDAGSGQSPPRVGLEGPERVPDGTMAGKSRAGSPSASDQRFGPARVARVIELERAGHGLLDDRLAAEQVIKSVADAQDQRGLLQPFGSFGRQLEDACSAP